MPHSFKLSRRIARFRAPAGVALLLSLAACNDDSFNPDRSTTPDPVDQVPAVASDGEIQAVPVAGPELATSFAGGVPIGTFHQPNSEFGSRYNGALRNDWPNYLTDNLATIRAKGGKVMLMMVGQQKYYKNADGTFSLAKWKARVDRYRKVNISQFINDGTIIGHYLIDEPYDPANWAGRPISGATLEEMAKYSKSIWPSMKTIVRAEPYLIKWSGTYRALDAAWAQYLWRKGDVKTYLNRNVSSARQMGLGLVVGLNLRKGGQPNGTWMTASEVQNWGSALLSDDYVCAMISWEYSGDKLNTSAMRDAMSALRRKAENHRSRSCSGG